MWPKNKIVRSKAFWHRNKLEVSVALVAGVTIALFVVDYLLLDNESMAPEAVPTLIDLSVAILLVLMAAMVAVPLIKETLTALKQRSRLDIMVRQSLLLVAGLVVAILLFLSWTPFPRILGLEGMGAWQKLLTAGGVVTLSAAIVGLVISYRKQRDAEDDKFNRDFATAASQLGDEAPAVRIAGVYAMAALADSNFLRRQRCIDVLCGHLRIPYNPGPTQNGIASQTIEEKKETRTRTHTYTYSPGEREVRQSIIRVIRDRLQPGVINSWAGCDFDFSGAVFDGVSLRGTDFSAGQVIFDRARFVDGIFDFSGVTFAEGCASFELTQFDSANLVFDYMRLEEGSVSFSSSKFRHSTVSFVSSTFLGGTFNFGGARLEDSEMTYLSAVFNGAYVAFDNISLVNSVLLFDESNFASGTINLDFIKLQDARLSLDHSTFSNTQEVELSLLQPEIIDGRIHRDGEDFHGYRWPPYGT